jgi:microcystin-dependent protein
MSDPYLGELRIVSFNFPPKGWAFCNGQLMLIQQNAALFSILGTTYGGDGIQTFGLPNLQGRIPVHMGNGFVLGQLGGEAAHTLAISEMPQHNHVLKGDSTTGSANASTPTSTSSLGQSSGVQHGGGQIQVQMYGASPAGPALSSTVIAQTGGQPHVNMSPYLVLNVVIALTGIFPPRD